MRPLGRGVVQLVKAFVIAGHHDEGCIDPGKHRHRLIHAPPLVAEIPGPDNEVGLRARRDDIRRARPRHVKVGEREYSHTSPRSRA